MRGRLGEPVHREPETPVTKRRVRPSQLVLALPLLLWGCGTAPLSLASGIGQPRRVITAAEIERSGATNAWEALERTGTPLQIEDEAMPEAARSRLALARLPRVVVDGIQMLEIRLLRDIPANVISRIRILSSLHGGAAYDGADFADVILIETRSEPRR